jgi:tetratricopeptide (TPR) repeat protein
MKHWSKIVAALLACIVCATLSNAQAAAQTGATQKQDSSASDVRLRDAARAMDRKDFALAAGLLAAYLKDHPSDAQAHFQLAYAYGALKRPTDAIPEYRRAVELNPSFAAAQLNLGLLLMEQGDFASAAKSFESAADLTPDQANPKFLAGVALERSGDLPRALAQYEAAASLDSKNYDIFFHWGIALLHTGRPADAEKELRAALALKPESDAARLALANALIAEKKPDAAAAELSEHLRANPNDAEARAQLASALFDEGKPSEALAELDRADALAKPTLEREKLRASILISESQWDAAAQVLAACVNLAPEDANLHAELGRILMQKRDFPDAERELRRALAIDNTMTVALRNLVSTEYLAQNYSGTLELLDVLARREPPSPPLMFIRGTCYDKLGRKAEAVDAYQKFLATDNGRSDKEEFQARERMNLLKRELSK